MAKQKIPVRSSLFFVIGWWTILTLAALSTLTAAILLALVYLGIIDNPINRPVVVTTVQSETPPHNEALIAAQHETVRLEREIAKLQRDLIKKYEQCNLKRRSEAPPLEEQKPQLTKEEICRLCAQKKTQIKGNTIISLLWGGEGYPDLDLHLICPGGIGHIHYNNKEVPRCDARLNADINAGGRNRLKAIENITIGKNAPPGVYRIEVHFYSKKGYKRDEVPFRLKLIVNGRTQPEITGTVYYPEHKRSRLKIHEFTLTGPNQERTTPRGEEINLDCSICQN